jgi:peptidoglycan/LPS O-acetylase OafA/YrhL
MPELDSARGLAILLVLLYHGIAPPVSGELSRSGRVLLEISRQGWVGVDLFFVLSGFLITGILIDSRNRQDYYRRFYVRRALRILPAFYASLVVLLIGGWISWRFSLLSVLFLANSTPLVGIPMQYGPLWSLAVEEHFYMLWPAIVRKLAFRGLVLMLATLVAATPMLRAIDFLRTGEPANWVRLYTWFNLDGLALGALLAIRMRIPSFGRVQLGRVAMPLLIVGVAIFVLVLGHPFADATLSTTASNIASAGLLSSMLLAGTSRWVALVDRPFLKFLGFISYGLYLAHVLAFRFTDMVLSRPFAVLASTGKPTVAMLVRFAVGSALAIGVAYLSRRSLEERFLRLGFASPRPQDGSKKPRNAVERPDVLIR